jgi:hypothetical protein
MGALRAVRDGFGVTWLRTAWAGVVRGWRVFTPEHTNIVLDSVSLIAITRGVLYGFGPQPLDPVPRGLDLLPKWMLYVYGVFWFIVGIFGVVTARRHNVTQQSWARWFLAMLCLVWAVCYFGGAVVPAEGVQVKASLLAGALYLLLARLAWNAGSVKVPLSPRALFVFRGGAGRDTQVFLLEEPLDDGLAR